LCFLTRMSADTERTPQESRIAARIKTPEYFGLDNLKSIGISPVY